MELFYTALVCLGFFISGYVVGLLQNGIKIYHDNVHTSSGQNGYNESLIDLMDPEVRQFLDKQHGNIDI